MKTFLQRFWQLIGALLLVIGSALLPILGARADNLPRFNQLEGDLEFLAGRNLTQNEPDFHDPVAATDDETVRIRVFYHNNASLENGEPGAPAVNTRIRLTLPTAAATTHVVSGTLSADNAEAVAGTFVNGQEVGESNLRINSPLPTTLEYIPGTVKWFPNRNEAGSPVTLPNGQTGDEIITPEGILLGDINGCWQFSGFVTLDVKLNAAGQANLVQAKAAVNETQGNVDARGVSTNAGDVIRYELTTRNTGERPVDYVVTDELNDILQYADLIDLDGGTVSGTVLTYPPVTIEPGQTITNRFKVQVKPVSAWPANGDLVLTNVYGNVIDVPVTPPPVVLAISLDKAVRNQTRNDSGYGFEVRDTKLQDVLQYEITIKNRGEKAVTNLVIKDEHDTDLTFVRGSVTITRDGVTSALNDDIFGNGYRFNSPLPTGATVVITYRMRVKTTASDGECLVNTVKAQADGIGEVRDETKACVTIPPVTPTTPTIPTEQPVTPGVTPVTQAPTTPVTPGQLPLSGPADNLVISLLGIVGSGATGWRYRRAKRALARAAGRLSVL